jgi:hypothetical protein
MVFTEIGKGIQLVVRMDLEPGRLYVLVISRGFSQRQQGCDSGASYVFSDIIIPVRFCFVFVG